MDKSFDEPNTARAQAHGNRQQHGAGDMPQAFNTHNRPGKQAVEEP